MEFRFKTLFLLVINVILMISSGLMAPFVILMLIAMPKMISVPVPMNELSIQAFSFINMISGYQMAIPAVLLLLSLVFAFFVMRIMIRQQIKFNKFMFVVFFANLVLLMLAIMAFLVQVENILQYYYSVFGYFVSGYCFAFIHIDFVLLVPFLVFFVAMYITSTNIKLPKQIVINSILGVVCLVCILVPFSVMQSKIKDLNIGIQQIKGIDYNTKLPDKKYTLITADGNIKPLLFKMPEGIPLNKHNVELIKDTYFTNYYLEASIPMLDYLRDHYLYTLNLEAIDNLYTESYKTYPQHELLGAILYTVALRNRVTPSEKSIQTYESMFYDESMTFSTSGLCVLSLLQTKSGKIDQAKKSCKPDLEEPYCEYCTGVNAGEIKKTTFVGQLIFNDIPLKDIPVLLQVNKEGIDDVLRYHLITDLSNTDQDGTFSLVAETKEQLALVIVREGVKNVVFDYSKLKDFKQGDTINLGAIVVE